MSIKVFRYGCDKLSRAARDAINAQLFLAFRYRLMLWHLATATRALYRQRRVETFPELQALEDAYADKLAALKELDVKKDKSEMKTLRQELKEINVKRKAQHVIAKESETFKQIIANDHEREGILRRALRNVFSETLGLYSGTYLCVEAADEASRRGKFDPVRPRWNGTGCLAVQFQGGRTPLQLYSGKDPSLHFVVPQRNANRVPNQPMPKGQGRRVEDRTTVRYRVRSENRKPVCVELPTVVTRDLPADGKVTWVKLVVRRIGDRFNYSVQFTVEAPSNDRSEFGVGTVAVCFSNETITYAAEGEYPQIFSYDPRLEKVQDLQSIRDNNRNERVKALRQWMSTQEAVPEWFKTELEANTAPRASCRRLVRFIKKIIEQGIAQELHEDLKAYVRKENHLYTWQSDMRDKALRTRKEMYRLFAARMRRTYQYLLLDNRKLDDPDRKKFERNSTAFDELRTRLRHSFGAAYIHALSADSCEEMFEKLRTKDHVAEMTSESDAVL